MKRRDFFSIAGTAGVGTIVAGMSGLSAAALAAQKTARSKPSLMKVGTQQGPVTDAMLQYFKRHGVSHICATVPRAKDAKDGWQIEDLFRLRELVETHGLQLAMLALPMGSVEASRAENPNIMLGKNPDRDREIDRLCEMIRMTARAGIHALKYNLTLLGVLRTESTPGRGGSRYSTWALADAKQEPPLTIAGVVGADEMWERITYFLKRVVPVAEECKVRLACHPHDPGVAPKGFRGVVRVLGTVEGLKRFVSIQESPCHGLNFCQGTVAELLADPGREIYEAIRYFGSRGKIFNVHFRNIRGRRDKFQEVYPDEGDVDMVRAMRIYREVGYDGMIMPDHMPSHADDPRSLQAFAFGYGYIKALIQAVATEV
ncbi:MAG: mannonate dehydratase [Verrucomicrobia bacterium]|nr:mannonate dehydratase [Verrucomicrobiota bacterium]